MGMFDDDKYSVRPGCEHPACGLAGRRVLTQAEAEAWTRVTRERMLAFPCELEDGWWHIRRNPRIERGAGRK